MSQFMFGTGTGRLSRSEIDRRTEIAEEHGCEFNLVTGNSGHCVCGWGCRLDACPVKTYWFAGPNYGQPFDGQLAQAVLEEVQKEK